MALLKKKTADKLSGVVKDFNPRRGFGFITSEDGVDYFFHYSQLQVEGYKTVKKGQAVDFEAVEGDRGLTANNIVIK